MSLLNVRAYERKKVIKLVAFVDIVQPLSRILLNGGEIVFRSEIDDQDSLIFRQNQSSTSVVILFVVIVCFFLIHLSMALKLLIATEQMDDDFLSSARNAKAWQNWAIVYLILLIASIFSNILSASSKILIVLFTIFGVVEIGWRLLGIYNVGKFIDELLCNLPTNAVFPTVQFFGVRFPDPAVQNVEESH